MIHMYQEGKKQQRPPHTVKHLSAERQQHSLTYIFRGEKARSLFDGAMEWQTPRYDVIASTDIGVHKQVNEDRAVVNVFDDSFTVMDGIGGSKMPLLAVEQLAFGLLESPRDMRKALQISATNMRAHIAKHNPELLQSEQAVAATCFLTARIVEHEGKPHLDIWQAGDARILVLDADGNITFVSEDQTLATEKFKHGTPKPAQALYDKSRAVVTNDFSERGVSNPDKVQPYPFIPIPPRGRVLLLSDGLGDNFTPQEIANNIRGKTAVQALRWCSLASTQRMKNAHQVKQWYAQNDITGQRRYFDGFASEPKPDNRTLIIIDMKA